MNFSKGLAWALSMLGLDLVELLVLSEIVFSDFHRNAWASTTGFIWPYFYLSTASFVVQLVGVVLVAVGWFRLGGILQIVSSSIHVPKGEGVIGVIGGVQAYRYSSQAAGERGSN
jgi:MFS superfamily sulfate permease-like transporter